MEERSLTVQDLGEQRLLELVQSFCAAEIVGDDGAVIEMPRARALVVTTDVLADGVHFSDRTTTPEDVGWRAAAANLSDLAAMGASPLGITVGLSLHRDVAVSWVTGLYQGLADCLQQYNTPILGGDICRASTLSVAITALGRVLPHQVIRRSAARPGDAIVVTGTHGRSRAGLELLLHPELGKSLSATEREVLIQAHQRPQPRLDVLPYLRQLNLDRPIAGMDSSDGLADAIVQICRASGVGATIERNRIPTSPILNGFSSAQQVLEWALYGGEDFELILCLPQPFAVNLVCRVGGEAAIVGEITTGREAILRERTSSYPDLALSLDRGFQHF